MQTKLPDIKNKAVSFKHFPTTMQAFIFRNWEIVNKERIAKVLKTDVKKVEDEAFRMGLKEQKNTEVWAENGYITIIRANWHLLPYEQLLELLDWSYDKLSRVLKEEDFLDIKLGNFKPQCEPLVFRELTEDEIEKTKQIKMALDSLTEPEGAKEPFDFWSGKESFSPDVKERKENIIALDNTWYIKDETNDETVNIMAKDFSDRLDRVWGINLLGNDKQIILSFCENEAEEYHKITISSDLIEICAGAPAGVLRALYRLEDLMAEEGGAYLRAGEHERKPRFGARYIYSFCALYEGAFDVDSSVYCPDSLLYEYSKTGVNGIWLQAVLYRLTEFPFDASVSEGWEKRQENLKSFIERARRYGIKIYLYINEPRTMPKTFFENYPEMKGAECGKYACMCLSSDKTQEYLRGAVERLCRAVPELGGFFTITMSENLTHCKSRYVDKKCTRCENVKPWELAVLANRLVKEGAHKVNPDIKVIAWDWAWEDSMGFEEGDLERAIKALPESVALMCKREREIPFVRGGITQKVEDYSLSVDGISEISRKNWKIAKESGHETVAKLQVNNTWECSTVPYLPVYGKLIDMMNGLIDAEVNHIMMSWTLGGYPSPNIKLISESFFEESGTDKIDYDKALRIMYGKNAGNVKEATNCFCEAFNEFPSEVAVLYVGPQNGGVSNLLYPEPTGYKATMTCYAYDDLEGWRSTYPLDVFENQFKLVSDKWEEGLKLLGDDIGELNDMAYISYSLFRSSYNQIRFVRLRDAYKTEKTSEIRNEILEIIKDEKEIAKKVYKIMCLRPSVGFEAANHYYYNTNMIKEKIINCDYLSSLYENERHIK